MKKIKINNNEATTHRQDTKHTTILYFKYIIFFLDFKRYEKQKLNKNQ